MSLHHHLGRGLHTIDPTCSLAHVARCMRDYKVHVLLVTDPEVRTVKGIVTLEDLLDAVAAGGDTTTLKVSDLMPTEVPVVHYSDLDPASLERLRREGWTHVALVDDRMRPLALLAVEEAEEPQLLAAA